MSHSSINDKLRQLARDIHDGVDNSEMVNAIAMPNEKHTNGLGFVTRCIMVVPKHTGWIVLQRIKKEDGTTFIASSFFESKEEADMFASNFDNVVAIMPIEWEE